MALLELKSVSSFYGSIQALHGVSLKVEQGEVVTLLGANGAGKSTTLRTISGLITPTSGEIWFEGHRIDTLAPEQIVRMGREAGFRLHQQWIEPDARFAVALFVAD